MIKPRYVRSTPSGHIFITPDDDPDFIVDAMLETGYGEEFCMALDFDPVFLAGLMRAGFLIMSHQFNDDEAEAGDGDPAPRCLVLPKLHLERSVLYFTDMHIKKSIRPFLSRYELRVDEDFDFIMEHCVEVHDDAWLTEALRDSIRRIRDDPTLPARPLSFGVYREGRLRAGEFGILTGKVYTSYSGYYDESNAGTVQMALTAKYLEKQGHLFWDLGMPLPYKDELGARNISPDCFVDLFRQMRM
jgi:Leu/Phe-tRNA-protein transferase